MKKNIFNIMLAIMSMAVTVSFTSCGGSNDDDVDNVEQDQSGVMGYKYVVPCLQWNATQDEVASYMSGIGGWSKMGTYASSDTYECKYPLTVISYMYGYNYGITGLSNVTVVYYSNKDSEFADLRNKIETTYNCSLLPRTSVNVKMFYADDVRINGRKTNIEVMSYTEGNVGCMSVVYSLSYE